MGTGEIAGRHMCFVRDGTAWMKWIRFDKYFAAARRDDGDRAGLFDWWVSAGPR